MVTWVCKTTGIKTRNFKFQFLESLRKYASEPVSNLKLHFRQSLRNSPHSLHEHFRCSGLPGSLSSKWLCWSFFFCFVFVPERVQKEVKTFTLQSTSYTSTGWSGVLLTKSHINQPSPHAEICEIQITKWCIYSA